MIARQLKGAPMNTFLKLTAAVAAMAGLAACDQLGLGGGTDSGSNTAANAAANATTNAAAPANASADSDGKDPATAGGNVATASAGAPGAVTRDFLIGRWTDNGDCNNTITFSADGTFTVPGGGSGLWVLDGETLTFQGGAGNRSARIQAPDANTIMLIHPDNSVGRSTRCT